ncbi:MAG: adenosylhomocysteinase [Desulfurococcales archaeon]|nr:adenosylhomocysteinase [Desulfurococcales archaeon]
MADYKVKDLGLASQGRIQLEWAEHNMPVVMKLRKRYLEEKPLEGLRVSLVLHVTKETGVLARTLKAWGAEVYLAASNPLSTQDDVAAALVEDGIHVYAWKGMSTEEYFWAISEVASKQPNLVVDDGGDLHAYLHDKRPDIAEKILGGTEETTTGVIRLRAMEKEGVLKYPVIAVNDAYTKFLFDNRYGTGQSTVDGILRATNILIAGRKVVVAGYGWVGRGIAMRMRGMGARVIVVEADPIRALEAVMDGFDVMNMESAAEIGEIFVTATGNAKVIRKEHFEKMRDGAILANSGHFNIEIDVQALEEMSVSKRRIRKYIEEYKLSDGRKLYLLAEGRLVNLVAAEGHPSEVMDMSFANQAQALLYILENKDELQPKVYLLPREYDENTARMKLEAMCIKIEELTEEQKKYLKSWKL